MMKPTHEPRRGFHIESAADLRPQHELADVAAVADEIVRRQQARNSNSVAPELAVASLDADKVWANYRKGRGTRTAASTLSPQTVDEAEVERRLRR